MPEEADAQQDDGLTQRERRAQRHRSTRAKAAPGDFARKAKLWRMPVVVLLVVAAGAGAIWYLSQGPDCPDHWHATQMVFVPDGSKTTPDGFDVPHRIDFSSPTLGNGPYYDFSPGNPTKDQQMSLSVHMHQSASSMETGSAILGPVQFHFEGNGKCVGIQNAYKAIDVDVSSGHLAVKPGTPLASVNPVGPWDDHGNQTLRFFLESSLGNKSWAWTEHSIGNYLHYQLRNGESMILAFGHYSDAQIQQMMNQMPKENNSRAASDTFLAWYHPPAATTSTSTTASGQQGNRTR